MQSRVVNASLDHEFTVIRCECGQQYSILSYQEREEYGVNRSYFWEIERVYYCPFCGGKNEELK